MACLIVPVVEAVVVTVAARVFKSKEKECESGDKMTDSGSQSCIPFSRKLKWLSNLLWGGSFLLAYEHVWHGEIVPWFPFLTAASDPAATAEMLHEMSTVGVAMSVLVTAVWVGMVLVSNSLEKKASQTETLAG